MADRNPVWRYGDGYLLYDPTTGLDVFWRYGDGYILDEMGEEPATPTFKPAWAMRRPQAIGSGVI
jgi:hypothetical protein